MLKLRITLLNHNQEKSMKLLFGFDPRGREVKGVRAHPLADT